MNTKYKNKLNTYRRFAEEHLFTNLDFSDKAAEEIFNYESKGIGDCNIHNRLNLFIENGTLQNGYAVGKRNMDITFGMWAEDLQKPGWLNLLKELRKEFGFELMKPFRKLAFNKSRERKKIFMSEWNNCLQHKA